MLSANSGPFFSSFFSLVQKGVGLVEVWGLEGGGHVSHLHSVTAAAVLVNGMHNFESIFDQLSVGSIAKWPHLRNVNRCCQSPSQVSNGAV